MCKCLKGKYSLTLVQGYKEKELVPTPFLCHDNNVAFSWPFRRSLLGMCALCLPRVPPALGTLEQRLPGQIIWGCWVRLTTVIFNLLNSTKAILATAFYTIHILLDGVKKDWGRGKSRRQGPRFVTHGIQFMCHFGHECWGIAGLPVTPVIYPSQFSPHSGEHCCLPVHKVCLVFFK